MIGSCPNCGLRLAKLETFAVGPLEIVDDGALIRWRGRPVRRLTEHETRLVTTLARSPNHVMSRDALLLAIGSEESESGNNLISVYLSRIKVKFRKIDPGFDAIETVWFRGLRWRGDKDVGVVQKSSVALVA